MIAEILQSSLGALGSIASATVAIVAIRSQRKALETQLAHQESLEHGSRVWSRRADVYADVLAHLTPMKVAIESYADEGLTDDIDLPLMMPTWEEWVKKESELSGRLTVVCSSTLWDIWTGYRHYIGQYVSTVLELNGTPSSHPGTSEDLRNRISEARKKVDHAYMLLAAQMRTDLNTKRISIADEPQFGWQ